MVAHSSRSDSEVKGWEVQAALGGLAIVIGITKLTGSFFDKPLFPEIDDKSLQLDLAMSPHSGSPMLMLSGTF